MQYVEPWPLDSEEQIWMKNLRAERGSAAAVAKDALACVNAAPKSNSMDSQPEKKKVNL